MSRVGRPLKYSPEIINFVLKNSDKKPKEIRRILFDRYEAPIHRNTILSWRKKYKSPVCYDNRLDGEKLIQVILKILFRVYDCTSKEAVIVLEKCLERAKNRIVQK